MKNFYSVYLKNWQSAYGVKLKFYTDIHCMAVLSPFLINAFIYTVQEASFLFKHFSFGTICSLLKSSNDFNAIAIPQYNKKNKNKQTEIVHSKID